MFYLPGLIPRCLHSVCTGKCAGEVQEPISTIALRVKNLLSPFSAPFLSLPSVTLPSIPNHCGMLLNELTHLPNPLRCGLCSCVHPSPCFQECVDIPALPDDPSPIFFDLVWLLLLRFLHYHFNGVSGRRSNQCLCLVRSPWFGSS